MYDLVIRGGRVIDPARGLDATLDVAIEGRRIAALGPNLAGGGARELLDAAGLLVTPGLVDVGGTAIPLDEILGMLDGGDVVTHCYHGRTEGALDEDGRVRPSVWQAAERGIVFDVGHGAGSFNFQVARTALAQGLLPGTI